MANCTTNEIVLLAYAYVIPEGNYGRTLVSPISTSDSIIIIFIFRYKHKTKITKIAILSEGCQRSLTAH